MDHQHAQETIDQEWFMDNESNFAMQVWNNLSSVDVSNHIQMKGNMKYLSWAWAWAELMKFYPCSSYDIKPCIFFDDGSCEVWTTLTLRNSAMSLTRDMWLYVMDFRNNPIKNPTSKDISNSRMRCLVKNIAMFGLGHYLYAGEDIPTGVTQKREEIAEAERQKQEEITKAEVMKSVQAIQGHIDANDMDGLVETYAELTNDELMIMSKMESPPYWGVFTTPQRAVLRSLEFENKLYAYTKEMNKNG